MRRKLHRREKTLEVIGGTIPADLFEARTLAVTVATLVVTIDMTGCVSAAAMGR
jgi:hypothetical protein